jgi:hypothetical protein
MSQFSVTAHALDRFMERSGASDREKATLTIMRLAETAIIYDTAQNKFHSGGWILVIDGGVVKTIYRVRTQNSPKPFKRRGHLWSSGETV